jgi:hypothetical protein
MRVHHEHVTRSPLCWPAGWKRTPPYQRRRTAFKERGRTVEMHGASVRLQGELDRLGARDAILSTNLRLRLDGWPLSNQPTPTDTGAAVYFLLKNQPRCLACDSYDTVAGNIAALAAHIDALRRIDRYGVGTLDQAFAGYTALPPSSVEWWLVLGLQRHASIDDVERAFREKARAAHPDVGGSHQAMSMLTEARTAARAELGA